VSGDVVIVTPRNTGLSPTLNRQNIEPRIRRIERLLSAVPDVVDIANEIPRDLTFNPVADDSADENARLEAFVDVTDQLGVTYEPGSCLTSCGFAWACRECAFNASSPSLAGGMVERALPGVASLTRVAELGRGAPPSPAEAPAAGPIARAGRLYEEVFVPAPRRRRA
jgi:hypothetical protein